MHARRSGGPADRAETDRLLDAARAGTPPAAETDPLTRLLSAAAGPATAGEVAGEDRAVAAFRAARAAPAPVPVPAVRPRRRLRIAAALSGLAATAVAGVAFAAVRLDRHPDPVIPPAPATSGPGATGPTATGPSRPAPSTPAGEASGAASPPTRDVTPTPTPSVPAAPPAPSAGNNRLAAHCRAYLVKSDRQREKALTRPGFDDLVTAAGGPEHVESYCRNLVGEPSGPPAAENGDQDEDD
ncbi:MULTISPECIES: hypothetical protein [unclassified Micromonospora]|uniref:hypothetical protein n=1 Tax=unclassified Micromonospora TaxID=2617518 RepID=UPI001FFD0FEA|nr:MULTISPECIES: hypothetical protein [unclassified Micromonospora]